MKEGFRPRISRSTIGLGVRVVTEEHPAALGASIGFHVPVGTADEEEGQSGLAHFVEHLVFKGTRERSAAQISREIEALGGDINAYTSRVGTSYVTLTLGEHVRVAVDVLSDLMMQPLFRAGDVEREKGVILQEIHSAEDLPEDAVFDEHFDSVFAGLPLSRPILGTKKSVMGFTKADVLDFYRRHYAPSELIVSAAGQCRHEEVCEWISNSMERRKSELKDSTQRARVRMGKRNRVAPQLEETLAWPLGGTRVIRKRCTQAHVVVGLPCPSALQEERIAAKIINAYLGGGTFSKLYQEVREKRGLVYSIGSSLNTFPETGTCLAYASCEPTKAPDVVDLVLKEAKALRRRGISAEEFSFFRDQLRFQMLLGADHIEGRMGTLAAHERLFGRASSVQDSVDRLMSVDLTTVNRVATEMFDGSRISFTVLGPLPVAPVRLWLDQRRKEFCKRR